MTLWHLFILPPGSEAPLLVAITITADLCEALRVQIMAQVPAICLPAARPGGVAL